MTDAVDCTWVDVVARDRHGLLAAVAKALADLDLDVSHAVAAVWPDGAALESFCVRTPATSSGAEMPKAQAIGKAVEVALGDDLASPPLPEASIVFDQHASPWHTACEIEAPDKPHLLHQLATAFAAAGVDVVAATVASHDGRAYDSFLLAAGPPPSGTAGAKLDAADEAAILAFVDAGVVTRHRRWRRPRYDTNPAAGHREPAPSATSRTPAS